MPKITKKTPTLRLVAPLTTASASNLSDAARKRAEAAIDATHAAYTAQNGLKATLATLDVQEAGASAHIYGLAVFAMGQAKKVADAMRVFSDLCRHAESAYKATWDVQNLKSELPVWAVFKSNILRGMRLNLNPAKYDTERAFRAATASKVRESLRQAVAQAQSAAGATAEPAFVGPPKLEGKVTLDEVTEMLSDTTIVDRLQTWLARLVTESAYVRKGSESEAATILQIASNALSGLLDKRRITDDATKQAIAA